MHQKICGIDPVFTIPDDIKTKLSGVNPIDLQPFRQLLEEPVRVFNAGMTTNANENQVVLRIEMESGLLSTRLLPGGRSSRSPPDFLGNRQWAIMIDKQYFIHGVNENFARALMIAKI